MSYSERNEVHENKYQNIWKELLRPENLWLRPQCLQQFHKVEQWKVAIKGTCIV